MTEPVGAAIAAEIRAAREASSLTRDELAAAAQAAGAPLTLTAAALRNIESGRRRADVDELLWLADALRTTPHALLGEHAARFSPAVPAGECGEVEAAARRAVEEIDGGLTGQHEVLAQSALVLARLLDSGQSTAPTAVAKELRATLAVLWEGRSGDDKDKDEDELGAA